MKKILEIGIIVVFIILILAIGFKFRSSYKVLQNDIKLLSNNFNEIKARNTDLNRIYLNSINVIPKDISMKKA